MLSDFLMSSDFFVFVRGKCVAYVTEVLCFIFVCPWNSHTIASYSSEPLCVQINSPNFLPVLFLLLWGSGSLYIQVWPSEFSCSLAAWVKHSAALKMFLKALFGFKCENNCYFSTVYHLFSQLVLHFSCFISACLSFAVLVNFRLIFLSFILSNFSHFLHCVMDCLNTEVDSIFFFQFKWLSTRNICLLIWWCLAEESWGSEPRLRHNEVCKCWAYFWKEGSWLLILSLHLALLVKL